MKLGRRSAQVQPETEDSEMTHAFSGQDALYVCKGTPTFMWLGKNDSGG